MTIPLRTIGIAFAIAQLTACSTINKPFDSDATPPKSLAVDAKQRVILVTDRGGPNHDRHVACAEPSPDVFVAAAANASVSADVGKQSGEGSLQYAETAATLSRGHTIQLLRDGLYRACEAYMNGALNQEDYRDMLAFYDLTMITTLTIEGVSQPKIPASAFLNASTQGGGNGGNQGGGNQGGGNQGGGNQDSGTTPDSAKMSAVADMLKAYYDTKLKLYDKVHQAVIEKLQLQAKGK
jgi:hypothetical protein